MSDEQASATGEVGTSRTQYVVRLGTVEDAAGIAEAHVLSWQGAYRGLLPQDFLDDLSVDRRAAQWQRNLRDGDFGVHVAVDPAGHVGGFVSTGRSRDEDAPDTVGELLAIYVRPALWSTGLGARLHAAGVADLATRFTEATLWVLDGNARGLAFYERQGWWPDGALKHDTIGGVEVVEVRLRRSLGAAVA